MWPVLITIVSTILTCIPIGYIIGKKYYDVVIKENREELLAEGRRQANRPDHSINYFDHDEFEHRITNARHQGYVDGYQNGRDEVLRQLNTGGLIGRIIQQYKNILAHIPMTRQQLEQVVAIEKEYET